MNDATPWIDPELVAAGKLLQEKGLVAPDRTRRLDRRGARRGRPHRRVSRRRLGPAQARARPVAARAARPGAVPPLSAGQRRTAAADRLRAWRRLYAGQPPELGPFCATSCARAASLRCRSITSCRPKSIPGGLRRDGRDDPPRGARGRRVRHRSDAARGRRRLRPAPIWRWRRRWRCAMPASGRSVSSC